MCIAVGCEHLEDSIMQLENGNIERAATQVIHRNSAVLALVESISERCGGGLVHQAQNVQARDAARILGGLPLGVVEVGGHRDNGLVNRHAEVLLGVVLQPAQHKG